MRHYKDLTLITPVFIQGIGYWYLIHHQGMSYKAFATFEGLSRWMAERGLNFSQELPERGVYSIQKLVGEFSECAHMSYDAFYSLEGHRTKQLSNGSYTLAIITADDTGHRTVNYMNPNCKDRHIFDYHLANKEMN